MYNIKASDFEAAIRKLSNKEDTFEFAVRVGEGTARSGFRLIGKRMVLIGTGCCFLFLFLEGEG